MTLQKSVACAMLLTVATGVFWAAAGARPATPAANSHPLTSPDESHSPNASGRLFLSAAQAVQARRSGTVGRTVTSLLAVPSPMHYGEFVWNDAGVPRGSTWIRVDLRAQLISIFRAGNEIGTAVIVYGGDNKQTPLGTLHVLAKARDHRSSLYDAEMPYTLRLTNDGVSIHASSVRWGAATHGCIGVPFEFARRLFGATTVGDEVEIVRSDRPS